MLNADIDTGQVDIVANSFSLRGRSIDEIAEQQLSDFVDAVYDPAISNLQSQIDGQIETWFYNYIPTTSNAPANQWTTDSEKDNHLGDLFYIVDNEEYGGQAYRWAKIGTEYKWDYVEDTATVKALADAAKAQDTADQKRRVFITTPVPPYDSGDLWMQGASGDIMTCVNSRQSGNYVSSYWEKKNKYTDDSAVVNLDESLNQESIFNRLTNNGQAQGIILQNGQLYINAEYIQSLILKVGGVNNENGTFEVYNGSGVLVGKIDKDGAKFTNGNDWLQIKNSLMTGGYGGTTDGLLDLSANYSGGERHVVLESKTGDVILKSSGDFLVERPGTGQGTLLQSGNYQYLTDVGDVEISSSETEELRAIALGESVARDASNNPIDALALIRKDTLSKVFYEGDYFSYFSSHIITGWRFVSLTTPTTIAPGYTWDLTANASGSGIPYRTGTEYLVIPVSTGWGAVGSIDQPTSAYGQGSTNFTVTLLNNGSSAHTIGCTCLVIGLLSRDLSPLA